MKTCKKCQITKDFSEFHACSILKDGHKNVCKSCISLQTKARYNQKADILIQKSRDYRESNSEKARATVRKSIEKNREKYNARKAEYYLENKDYLSAKQKSAHSKDPRSKMLSAAKKRAKNKSLPFNITVDDIYIPEICPILEIPLEVSKTGKPSANSPSLDRIIPSLGYVKGNIMVISHRANTMKLDASIEELIKFSEYMLNKLKEENV